MDSRNERTISQLLASDEPSIVWKIRTGVLGESPESLLDLGGQIRQSPRVRTLLDRMFPGDVYAKWHGGHWVLSTLADLGYPPGSPELVGLRDRVQDRWLAGQFFAEFEASSAQQSYARKDGVPVLAGRFRRCGSQQGNALRTIVKLGLIDERTPALAERLLYWQWPDGGWNCDRRPEAATSSFMETLWPMRGLAAYGDATGDRKSREAAIRAAEVFLTRELAFRRRDAEVMHPDFLRFHYPLYWHYDLLGGLVGIGEVGLLDDPRCERALDLLEEARLPDGGWPATARFYTVSSEPKSNSDSVDWGGTSRSRMNPWVTVDALTVLARSGRL
ncbi:MAG TPA: hypothetical protein VIA81_11195 [Acidimicrobiia bacterium]